MGVQDTGVFVTSLYVQLTNSDFKWVVQWSNPPSEHDLLAYYRSYHIHCIRYVYVVYALFGWQGQATYS